MPNDALRIAFAHDLLPLQGPISVTQLEIGLSLTSIGYGHDMQNQVHYHRSAAFWPHKMANPIKLDFGMKNKAQSERQVVDALGVWAGGKGPLHLQLTEAFRGAISRHDLAPGYRLPAERELARALAVSRTTIVAALNQLREEKLVVSKLGAGTWVTARSKDLDVRIPETDVFAAYPIQRLLRATNYPTESLLEMAAAAFFEPLGLQEALSEINTSDLRGAGYRLLVTPRCSAALAEDLTARGVPTVPSAADNNRDLAGDRAARVALSSER